VTEGCLDNVKQERDQALAPHYISQPPAVSTTLSGLSHHSNQQTCNDTNIMMIIAIANCRNKATALFFSLIRSLAVCWILMQSQALCKSEEARHISIPSTPSLYLHHHRKVHCRDDRGSLRGSWHADKHSFFCLHNLDTVRKTPA